MMRGPILLAGLLIATPALASDGTYRGSSELAGGPSGYWCAGETWELNVTGTRVKASRMGQSHGSQKGLTRFVLMEGNIQGDGSIAMSGYSIGAGNVELVGKFTNGSFEGISRTKNCEYRTTATKSSW